VTRAALTPDEALAILRRNEPTKRERIATLMAEGYPAYTTSAGWLGYADEKIRRLCGESCDAGFTHVKMKVGRDLEDDVRRCAIVRETIGPERKLMLDANQWWDVPEAIAHMKRLAPFKPWWIEEPTSPDDVLGHTAIARELNPLGIGVATGEHCANRILFKQFMQAGGMQFCNLDACRVGGVNECLAVMLLAAKFDIPICPHAGGVGLCEYVQHLSMWDYVSCAGTMQNRVIEYVDHLREHFVHPVRIERARYMPPAAPGYSIEMKPASLEKYEFT
jgi:L-fuconate dehydratase